MPELPEVENTVRDLKPLLVGHRILAVQVLWPCMLADKSPEAFSTELVGRQIVNADRRGKYLLFLLDNGRTLVVHLRMTGQFHLVLPEAAQDKHVHLVLDLDDGQQLRFRDTRKFGRFYLVDHPNTVVGKLGPEPLSEAFHPPRPVHSDPGPPYGDQDATARPANHRGAGQYLCRRIAVPRGHRSPPSRLYTDASGLQPPARLHPPNTGSGDPRRWQHPGKKHAYQLQPPDRRARALPRAAQSLPYDRKTVPGVRDANRANRAWGSAARTSARSANTPSRLQRWHRWQ